MEHKLSATVLKLEGDLIRIYIHERDLLCLLPVQNIYLNDGSSADSLLKIRDKLDIIYSDGSVKGLLSGIEATLGIIIEVTDTLVTIRDQEGKNQYEVPIQEIYNTSDRMIIKGARVRIQEVKRDLRRCSYIHDSISPANPVHLVELPLLRPNLYGGQGQILAPYINPGKDDQAANFIPHAKYPTPSYITFNQFPHTTQERVQSLKPTNSLEIPETEDIYKHYNIVQAIENPYNAIMLQPPCKEPLPSISIKEEKLISNPDNRDLRSNLKIATDDREAPSLVNLTRKINHESTKIPDSVPQARDKCLFCNEIKNVDEFYKDKICKCKMCLSCYFEQQSFTTCKKCLEPLSMEKMSSCRKCRTKKFERYIIALECKHNYCQECLKDHIQFELRYSNGRVSCPYYNCREPISIEIRDQIIPQGYAKDDKSIKSNETPSSSSHGRRICNICNYSDTVVFITRLDCNHSICIDCLKKYLDYKIDFDLIKRKGIECCVCDIRISDETIKKVVDPVTYNQYISKMGTRFNIRVKCPKNHRTVPHRKNTECEKCRINFCVVCKKDPHSGICGKSGFRTYLGYRFKDVCPECNKRSKIARNSVEKYVVCKNPDCNTSFCKHCYQRYSPILSHGPLYHKSNCEFYQYSDYNPKYKPLECEECKKL